MSTISRLAGALGSGRRWPGRTALLLWSAVALADIAAQPFRALAWSENTDYVAFVTGAKALGTDAACLYCNTTQQAAQTSILGHAPLIGLNQFVNPPAAAWVMRPFAALDLRTGLLLFTMLSLACLVLAVVLMTRTLPAAWPADRRALMAITTVVLLDSAGTLAYGQWNNFLLLALVLALRCALHGDNVRSGVLLSVLLLKPQLVWLVVPMMVVTQSWRMLAGMAAGGAAWLASSIALIGPTGFGNWVRDVLPNRVGEAPKTAGLPGLFAAAGGGDRLSFAVSIGLAMMAVAVMWRYRWSLRADPAMAIAVAVAMSVLCSPHVFDGDIALVGVLAALFARRHPFTAAAGAILVGLASAVDSATGPASGHLEVIAALALVAVVLTRSARPRSATDPRRRPRVEGAPAAT